MKGKSRVLLLEGEVEVPSRAEQVVDLSRITGWSRLRWDRLVSDI